jgi:hypothetical protein
MVEQLSLFENTEKEQVFQAKTEMYNKWLTLPDKILIRDGTPERVTLSTDLWNGYCKLYGQARHECENVPEDEYIWMNPCSANYWVLHIKDNIEGKHVKVCPYCGAELGNGKGDASLYKAGAKYWLFYLHYDKPMHDLGFQPKEDREAIRKVWG